MPPSKVRKEEAELRKIAKQARDTRKQVKAREKKTQQRAVKNGGVVESTTSSTPRKRQAAMILPDEVAELRVRMEEGSMASDAGKTKKSRTASPAKGKKGASKAAAAAAAAAGPSPQTVPEPPYHLEVHFRRKELQIDVTLHKIPESKIDISETNDTQLVVDTTKHTKQWRLALPYPDGVSVDAEAGTYELENGVLHCRLPLVGDIPAHLQEKWDAVIQKMREQRAMRFHVTRDGALTVRTRRALLSKDAGAPAKKASPSEADTVAEGVVATEVKGAAAGKKNAKAAPAKATPAKAAQKRGRDEKEPATTPAANKTQKSETASPAEKRAKVESAGATAAATKTSTRTRAAKKPKDGKADVFKQDHERAMAMAKAAAAQSKASIRERVQQAIEVQKKRQAKMETREVRKEVKLQRRQESFAKVLQQQKEQLLAQAAMVEAATTRPSAAKKDSGKSVSFAG